MTTKQSLLEALNRIDELASEAVRDNNNGEAEELEKDYNTVFDFLNNKMAIEVPLSQSDIEDLQNGGSFDWIFPLAGTDNMHIDVRLRPENEDGE